MPMGFHIYPDVGLLFIRASGVTMQPERIRTMRAWLQDPHYQQCLDALFDLTQSQSTPKLSDLRELIGILKKEIPERGPRKLAIVAPKKPITVIFARVFEELMRLEGLPLDVKIFLNREHAWNWLRPGEPAVEPR